MAAQTGNSGGRASHLPRTTPHHNTMNYQGLIRHEVESCPPYGATSPLSGVEALGPITLFPPGSVDFREVTSPALRSVADSSSMLHRPGGRWQKTPYETSHCRHQSQQQCQANGVAIDDAVRVGSPYSADPASVGRLVAMPTGMSFQQFQQQPLYGSAHVPMTRMRQTAVTYGTARTKQQQQQLNSAVYEGGPIGPSNSTPTTGMYQPTSSFVAKVSVTGGKMSTNQYSPSCIPSPEISSSSSQQLYSIKSQSAPRRGASVDNMTSARRQFPTNFAALMVTPGVLPMTLSTRATPSGIVLPSQNAGKIKVVLRVAGVDASSETCLTVSADRRQVVVHDPASSAASSTSNLYRQRASCTVPRLFSFDNVFTATDSLADLCSGCLDDALHSVLGGTDSCVFSFGASRLGKTYTMIGLDDSNPKQLGVIPSAISWLFQMIGARREQTGARFSVRVSAVELTGKNEQLKDLLSHVSTSTPAAPASVDVGGLTSPGPVTRDEGLQLSNVSEIRAPTAESAAFLLDAAIATRTVPDTDEDAKHSHLLFTLHVYQYRVETARQGENTVAGGRSRLHIVDLGSCGRVKDGSSTATAAAAAAGTQSSINTALSLSALGTVISALLSGQRQLPHRDSKLTQLMREALGGSLNHACAIVHVTPAALSHSETTQVIQLASRIQRTKVRRRVKAASSSDGSSCDGSSATSSSSLHLPHWYSGERRRRAGVKMGVSSRRSAHSDPETSSCISGISGRSCDTVIHVRHGTTGSRRGHHSDRDYTDSETGSSVITAISAKSSPSCTSRTSSEHRSQLQHLARSRRHARTSGLPIYHPATIVEHPDEEQWIDGPRSTSAPAVEPCPAKSIPVPLDGSTRRSASSRSRHQPPVLASNELWVDGPAEFQTLSAQKTPANIPVPRDEGRIRKDRTEIPCVNASPANCTQTSVKSRVEQSMVSTITPSTNYSSAADVKKFGNSFNNRTSPANAERTSNNSRLVSDRVSSSHKPLGSSPHLPRAQQRSSLPPPDGRVAAWVQSVREAAISSGTLSKSDLVPCRELCLPDGSKSAEVVPSKNAEETTVLTGVNARVVAADETGDDAVSKDVSPTCKDEDDGDRSCSDAAGSGHSMYEKNVDECLETGSQAAVASSDEDAAWDAIASSMHPAADRRHDDHLSTCLVEQFFDVLDACPKSNVGSSNVDQSDRPLPSSFLPVRRAEVRVAHVVSPISKTRRDVSPLPRRAFSTPRHVTSTPKAARSKSSSVLVARGCAPVPAQDHASPDRAVPSPKCCSTRSCSADSRDQSQKKLATAGKHPHNRPSSSSCASPRLSGTREDRRSRLPVVWNSNTPLSTEPRVCSSSSAKVRLLSPYHAVTSPRRVRAAANSDSSSLLSDPVTVTSSGYESMLRGDDSDDVTADGVSSTNQSVASDCCSETRIVGRRIKEITSAALSSSSAISSPDGTTVQPSTGLSVWTQLKGERISHSTTDQERQQVEPVMSKDTDKAERTKLTLEVEAVVALKRIQRVDELLERRRSLACDLAVVKNLLGVGARKLSSPDDQLVDYGRDRSDVTYLQQLESETVVMERHLRAYQSRIMMVTCFDSQSAV